MKVPGPRVVELGQARLSRMLHAQVEGLDPGLTPLDGCGGPLLQAIKHHKTGDRPWIDVLDNSIRIEGIYMLKVQE